MPPNTNYTVNVDARVGVMQAILDNAPLLEAFEAAGGLRMDLEEIITHGQDAAALNALQGSATTTSADATLEVARNWTALQDEYKNVMAIVQAVIPALEQSPGNGPLCAELKGILKNETAVTIVELDKVDEEGKPIKVARKVVSVGAVRGEIESDFTRLEAAEGAHAALGARRVPKARLTAGKQAAKALKGKLTDATLAKAKRKAATAGEGEAVRRMRKKYASVFRILGRAARSEKAIADLLKTAARPR